MIKNYKKLFLALGAVLALSTGTALCAQPATAGWVSEDGVWKYRLFCPRAKRER